MNDAWTIRAVVILLGCIALGGLTGTIALSALGRPISESAITITASAVGALGSILARTSTADKGDKQNG